MERFWRTLRQGCLDFLGALSSLHDINVRLWAFVDQHYNAAPHASLLGCSPATVWAASPRRGDDLDERRLREALTVRSRRRVRRDTTVSLDGGVYELDQGFLAGRIVVVARCLVAPDDAPWVEHDGKKYDLHPVNPVANSDRRRPPRRPGVTAPTTRSVPFDPPKALLDRAVGRPSVNTNPSDDSKGTNR
jgi:hypothetical protein